MSSRLKSLELSGYKTFANRTLFEFAENVTSIVGPNGSGKSNIADSMRWVLGEQSYRLLRGKKTEDMIFSGSENRPRAGMAYATITFNNEDGWLPIDFNEVAITRRAYRDGQNEYLINGQRVRLMDVSELLSQSGLAERTYTIIGQGLVDAALSLRADERRRLFEEAAGIGLHRSRREEALRRLDVTKRNLERVNDILAELKPRLRSLERQATRAKDFSQVKSDLMVLLREWYGYHWQKSQAELAQLTKNADERGHELKVFQNEQMSFDRTTQDIRQKTYSLRGQINEKKNIIDSLRSRKEDVSRELAVRQERQRSLKEQLNLLMEELKSTEQRLGIQNELLLSSYKEIELIREKNSRIKNQFEEINEEFNQDLTIKSEIEKELQRYRDEQTKLKAQIESLKIQRETNQRRILDLQDEVVVSQRNLNEQKDQFQVVQEELREIEDKIAQEQSKLLNLRNDRQNSLVKLEEEENRLQVVKNRLDSTMSSLIQEKNNRAILEQAQTRLSGYPDGTRILLKAAEENEITGLIGALRQLIEVPEEYEMAISAALGIYLNAVLIDNEPDMALDLLEKRSTPGVIIPIGNVSQETGIFSDMEKVAGRIIGLCSESISYPSEIKPIVDTLLGNIAIVRDRATAIQVLEEAVEIKSVVTLIGEVFNASGSIIIHGSRDRSKNKYSINWKSDIEKSNQKINQLKKTHEELEHESKFLQDQIKEIKKNITNLEDQGEESENKLSKFIDRKNLVELELEKLEWLNQQEINKKLRIEEDIASMHSEDKKISVQYEKIESAISAINEFVTQKMNQLREFEETGIQDTFIQLRTEYAVSEQVLQDSETLHNDKKQMIEDLSASRDNISDRINVIGKEVHVLEAEIVEYKNVLGEVLGQIKVENQQIEPLENQLKALDKESQEIAGEDNRLRRKIRDLEQRYTNARIEVASQHEVVEGLRSRIEDDFGLVNFEYSDQVSGPTPLPFEGLVEELPEVENISPETEKSIKRLRSQLRRIGPTNPEAEEEYREVQERHEFLTNQIEDLKNAEADVRQVISELDILMEEAFCDTFDKVAEEFKEIFSRLFGGGAAQLILSDPNDITNTGIEIDARLPGRRTQGLSLLSGGERSLTAVALIFALIRVSPTPFCLLDEVDAMLDEANTQRFRALLREMSQQTQFVVVTHNRNTVEAAEVIYGVTMGRDSASQVISLNIDELSKVID